MNIAATAAAGNVGVLGGAQAHVGKGVDDILVVHVGISRLGAPDINFMSLVRITLYLFLRAAQSSL